MSRWAITKNILARAIVGKEGGKTLWQKMTEEEKVRADKDFPLNMRILARVDLDLTNYLLAEKQLAMPAPVGKGTIVEIGTITHDDGLVDYLARIAPDHATEEQSMSLLLIETQHGKVLATTLFTQAMELYPDSVDEIDNWLNEDDGILGREILTDPEGREYDRVWGEGEQVEPMKAREKVLADRYGEQVTTNKLVQMMFVREIKNDAGETLTEEYALVSYVNEECVEIMLGIPVIIKDTDIIGA